MRTTVKAAIFLLSLLGSSLATQQNPSPDQKADLADQPQTVIKTTTRLVIVDVVAHNDKGNPVTDLKSQDFAVLENGKPQQVKVFNFQSHTTASAKTAQPVPTIASGVVTNIPAYPVTSAFNVILLDGLNTTAPRQAYMRERMLALLDKLPDGQPIAVYTLGTRLRLIQDFTSDHQLLKKTLHDMHNNISVAMNNPSGGPAPGFPASFISQVPENMGQRMQEFLQQSTTTSTQSRVGTTLNALHSIARFLAGLPGRKNLIWVSDAFPMYVNPAVTLKPLSLKDDQNFGQAISKAANTLMESQVVIYPVDAHGVMVPAFDDIGLGKPDDAVGGRPAGGNYAAASLAMMSTSLADSQATHETMNRLAESTGGQAFYNNNDLDVLIRKSIDDGSTYYTLGYYPTDKNWDGNFRKIQVKVTRPGVKLHYRLGYYAVQPDSYLQEDPRQHQLALEQALNLNSPVSTGLPFRAKVLPPSEKTENKIIVNFAIDSHMLSFEKNAAGLQTASVDCVVQAYAKEDTPLKAEATTIHAELTDENYAKISSSYFPCQQTLNLPPGSYLLRLGVVDNRTGVLGTANARVKVD